MPRNLEGTGRYAPQPLYEPFSFYAAVRMGLPAQLNTILEKDPYFITQDNGGGAPVHFATTYKQLDMLHYLLDLGAPVNQQDDKGLTPLHRAAMLFSYDGFPQIYEYLLSRGADPSIKCKDFDPYLNPGEKLAVEMTEDTISRDRILALEKMYAQTRKAPRCHPDIGDWWTLYDYGLDTVKSWDPDYKHIYPEEKKRAREREERRKARAELIQMRKDVFSKQEIASVPKEPPSTSESPIAVCFPGQGSQVVGMCKAVVHIPEVREMFEKAKAILDYDLLDICLKGPKEKLDDTRYAQPALFVSGLAAVEKLRLESPQVLQGVSAAAGLSLGEYSALVFAGALSYEEALRVVKVRAESMAEAAQSGEPHGMLSIIGLGDAEVEALCSEVRSEMPYINNETPTVCQLANYLFPQVDLGHCCQKLDSENPFADRLPSHVINYSPQGRVVSGHKKALELVQRRAAGKGALKATPLAVSGGFHTPLMKPASDKLLMALRTVNMKDPRIPVYSNVTGQPFTSGADIEAMLVRQLIEPVKWEDSMKNMIGDGKTQFHELGPGAQIKAMCKRIDNNVWKSFKNVQP